MRRSLLERLLSRVRAVWRPNAWKTSAEQVVRGVAAVAQAERVRWPLWLPVGLGAGAGVYFALPFEPSVGVTIAAGGMALVSVVSALIGTRAAPRAALALFATIALGFVVAKAREEVVTAPILISRIGPVPVYGRVAYAEPHGNGVRVVLDHVVSPRLDSASAPTRVRVSFRAGAEGLVPGDEIKAMAVLMPPPGPAAPDAYDFARTAFFDGIGAVGYAYGRPQIAARADRSGLYDRALLAIETLRWRMTERMRRVLPGSEGAIAAAILTGERGGISEDDQQSLRDAGLAHVLAIAGLHMALVGMGLFWVVRAVLAAVPGIALNHKIKKWAAGAALCGATFYLVVSGAAAPTIRAFTMLAMMLLSILADRPALSMRSMALAAGIILLVEPESLVEPGFQMSFAAVVSLIAVAEWEQRRAVEMGLAGPKRFPALRRYLRGIATTSLVGSLATLPYAIFHFDRATHYAVLGNLLAMPIMGFVTMPAGAVAVVLMPFGLDAAPLHVMGWGIRAMLAVGRFVSRLPGAVSVVAAWPVAALVWISLGGLWTAIWQTRWRWLGIAAVALGVALGVMAPAPAILVGHDGVTIAVRGRDGALRLLPTYRDGYSANEWLTRDGDARSAPDAIAGRGQGVSCDSYGCIARLPDGRRLAAPLRADAFAEDCASAEVIVSAVPAHGLCSGPKLVIDVADATKGGGYAIALDGSPRAVATNARRGNRPWNPPLIPADEAD